MKSRWHFCRAALLSLAFLPAAQAQPETGPWEALFTGMSLSQRKGHPGISFSFRITPQAGHVPLLPLASDALTVTDSTGKDLSFRGIDFLHHLKPADTEDFAEDYTVDMYLSSDSLPDARATSVSLKGAIPVLAADKKQALPWQAITLGGDAVSIPLPERDREGKKKSITVKAQVHEGLIPVEGFTYWRLTIAGDDDILFHSLSLKDHVGKELPPDARHHSHFGNKSGHQWEMNWFHAIPKQEKTLLIRIFCLSGKKTMNILMDQTIGLGGPISSPSNTPTP